MRLVHRRYLARFVPAMAGYCALIGLYGWLVPRTGSVGLRTLLALLPMLPVMMAILPSSRPMLLSIAALRVLMERSIELRNSQVKKDATRRVE